MAAIIPPVFISRPGSGPEVLPYGLFAVANGPMDLPEHGSVGGMQYQTPYCGLPDDYAVACPPASKAASLTPTYSTVTGTPFVALAGMVCGALTHDDRSPDEYTRDFVVNRLRAGEQRMVERVLSTGASGTTPSFQGGTDLGASADIVDAFGLLESSFAAVYGLPGTIHVPILASAMAFSSYLVEWVGPRPGGRWVTANGNTVSFGNYAGTSPLGAAPAANTTYLYMTSQVNLWRQPDSEIFVSPWAESIDKTTNQIRRFAERSWVLGFECPALGTQANYKVCCPGVGP